MKDLLFAMYMGGPDSIEAIRPFLKNLFSDRTIIDFKIGTVPQNILAGIIAKSRSRKVAPLYEKMGGSSPQLRHMDSVLNKLKELYANTKGQELDVEIGMCYYHPYIEESLEKLNGREYNRVYLMTMYPQASYTTSGLCFKRFDEHLPKVNLKGNFKRIDHWHLNRDYNICLVKRIEEAAERLGKPVQECHILFSAHSLPEYTVKKGDVYTRHLREQIEYITGLLKTEKYSAAFQSRTGPVKWLGPETDKELERIYELNIDNIIVVPISFVSDHIETLIELDEEYLADFKNRGMNIVRTESLNDSDDFAEALLSVLENV
ncbi:ferrochelatase [Limisalsivibrio acetivorans]|uniref:ferrochelatase n=1 Tax=Limisalsivibrio acetivorans TaxID=1304888 RepID=UPI0003B35975|nr:ferrochelatase [Limisalsivibrio acetivorans]